MLVPKLEIATFRTAERVLPDEAEGEIEVWAGNDGFEAYGYAAGGHYWAHLPSIASFRFDAGRSSTVAIPDADVPPALVEDAYLRNVLPLVVQLRGHEVLHASAVDVGDGLVVFCGASGQGKSTFAYGLSTRGYSLWADDAVVLDVGEAGISALHVPFRLGLRPEAASFFGRERDNVAEDDLATRSPVDALVVLQPSDRLGSTVVRIARLEPTAAFVALLPHAYYFRLSDAAQKARMLDRYLQLASAVTTFELRYRRGLEMVSVVLDALEERVLAC